MSGGTCISSASCAPSNTWAKNEKLTQQNAQQPNFRGPNFPAVRAFFAQKSDELFDRSDIQPASVQAAIIIPVTMEMVMQPHCLDRLDRDESER